MVGLLGALYCAGVPLDEIESEILRLAQPEELLKLVDLRVTASGISIKGARIYEFLTATLGGEIRFEALPIWFCGQIRPTAAAVARSAPSRYSRPGLGI